MSLVRMQIQTVVVGGLQTPSFVVLRKYDEEGAQVHLPIRIGPVEAAAITAGIDDHKRKRPLTHDLLASVIDSLGGRAISVSIIDVSGTTFFASLQLARPDGSRTEVDCRPSDGIALAIREGIPIYVREQVLETATMPDFQKVKKDTEEQELLAFHNFVEGLTPEDFSQNPL